MADLSGTDLVTGVSVPDMAGGFAFRTAAGALSGITIKSAYRTFDGVRRARLRWDTRPFGGVVLSVSAGAEVLEDSNTEENYDVAATYRGDRGHWQIQGALGGSVTRQVGQPGHEEVVGSFSALHKPTGLNLTLSGGQADPSGRGFYAKLGYKGDWLPAGKTAVSVDYTRGKDILSPGSVSRACGFGVVQNLTAQRLDLFFGYRAYDLTDTSGTG